jgi:hypothetical protein
VRSPHRPRRLRRGSRWFCVDRQQSAHPSTADVGLVGRNIAKRVARMSEATSGITDAASVPHIAALMRATHDVINNTANV